MGTLHIILDLLKLQGKRQKDLTDYLGISKNAFTNWKSGNNTSYIKYLPEIAEFFSVSTDYLLGRTDDPLGGVSNDLTEDLIIYSRDGKTIKKKMSKDAMRLLTSMLDALPEDDNPDL